MIFKAPPYWVASPLGFNTLLSVLKEKKAGIDKYKNTKSQELSLIAKNSFDHLTLLRKVGNLTNIFKNKEGCEVRSKLFISRSKESKANVYNVSGITHIEETDFSKNINIFTDWVNKHRIYHFEKDFTTNTEFMLANIILFKQFWQTSAYSGDGTFMKVYNSFNYTDDIKYEARVLELPLRSDFKLVIIVPNETDVLHTLFSTLTEQGMTAAIKSIQPLFKVSSELKAPSIRISSRIQHVENISTLPDGSAVQYGSIAVDKKGVNVKILTCIYSPVKNSSRSTYKDYEYEYESGRNERSSTIKSPFYFAVVFKDIAIFTGHFAPR